MAAAPKTLSLDKANAKEGWTVVLPRRRKNRRSLTKTQTPEKQLEQSWVLGDIETDPDRELKLMQKMERCIQKLENSHFWHNFLSQIESPESLECFFKALRDAAKFQMVIYGIGSIESYEPPRLQLSLAILMKRNFAWIESVEVFDPVISLTESRVFKSLGCLVLSVDEQCRRRVSRPIIFFMPHCEDVLYENLLQTNWTVSHLSRMVLFGNSFEAYHQHSTVCKGSPVIGSRKHILAARRFTREDKIDTISDEFYQAFNCSSWHFFNFGENAELQPVSSYLKT